MFIEVVKYVCKLVCELQRVEEKEFFKISLLQRGGKNEFMKENEEIQGNKKIDFKGLRGCCLFYVQVTFWWEV